MFCKEWVAVNLAATVKRAVSLPCKAWSCPDCAPRKQARLAAKARAGLPDRFITLTVNPAIGRDKHERARMLRDAWQKLRWHLERRHGYRKIQHLAVFEETARGEAHMHILCRCEFIDQAWLSAWMAAEIGAPIVDVRKIKSRRTLANYVTKYIAKEPARFEGVARWSSSRSYDLGNWAAEQAEKKGEGRWEMRRQDLTWMWDCWVSLGWKVWLEDGELKAFQPKPP